MAYGDGSGGPRGVGGWMYLFLFGFAGVSPLMLTAGTYWNLYGNAQVAQYLGDRWMAYQVASWGIAALGLAVIGFIVWRLLRVFNPMTVLLTMIGIPALGLGLPMLDLAASVVIARADYATVFAAIFPALVRSVIYSVIWCSYFNVSKRVRNTYYATGADDVADAFE